MASSEAPTSGRKLTHVRSGDYIVLEQDRQKPQLFRVTPNSFFKLGKKSFSAAPFIGQPFGSFFQLEGKKFARIPASMSVSAPDKAAQEPPTADNRNLQATEANQRLNTDAIETLKKEGVSGEKLIETIVEGSSTFASKTEFSQEKYLKRKKKKYLQEVRLIKPTARTITEALFGRNANKICFVRYDSLAYMLLKCNVRPGIRAGVVEQARGLIVAAVADRLGGTGTVYNIHTADYGETSMMECFNFSDEDTKVVKDVPLAYVLGWTGKGAPGEKRKRDLPVIEPGSLDCLIYVLRQNYEPTVLHTLELLAPGHPFCVFSANTEPLVDLQTKLVGKKLAIRVKMTELKLRDYQVLPMRTHPMMNMNDASGFVLFGLRCDSDAGAAAAASEYQVKRARLS